MSTDSVPKWEVFELTFHGETHQNPFLDVYLTVRFRSAAGVYRIDGFYDGAEAGAPLWRVRFAPMFEGEWTYRTMSNAPLLDGIEGSFTCTAAVSRGGLALSPQFPNWFFRQDGRPELIVNDGWTPHGGPDFPRCPSEEEFMVFVAILADHGVNMIVDLKQLSARQEIDDDSFLWPWPAGFETRFDADRFNLKFFRRLDRQIAAARDRDVFYGVELLYDNSTFRRREWSRHPWNERNGGWLRDWDRDDFTPGWGIRDLFDLDNEAHVAHVERYLAYTVARTAAYRNVFYALGCESSNIFPGIAITIRAHTTADWYQHWGDYLARSDPHGRLVTLGDVGEHARREWHRLSDETADLFRHRRNNIIVTQEHTPMANPRQYVESINAFGERFWPFSRPTVLGEQDLYNRGNYDLERRGYWVALMSGFGMGRVDRHLGLADGDQLHESAFDGLGGVPSIYADVRRMRAFFEETGARFWRMAPADELLSVDPGTADATEPTAAGPAVYCLAEPGEEYLLYFAFGGAVALALTDAEFTARWFDPRTGALSQPETITGGTRPFQAPGDEDWLLYVERGA